MKLRNIFDDLPAARHGEVFEILAKGIGWKIERIVSRGQKTPKGRWLYEETAEWVILLKGQARLLFKKGRKIFCLKPGDYLLIPPCTCHRVHWTSPKQKTVWLAIHIEPQPCC